MRRLLWKRIACPDAAYHVARAHMRGRYPFQLHAHDFAEVFWIENGNGIHDINGQRHRLSRGSLVTIRPGDSHGFRGSDGGAFTLVNVAFPVATLDFLRRRYFSDEKGLFWTTSRQPFQTTLQVRDLRWLRDWVERLDRAPHQQIEIDHFLIELVQKLSIEPSRRMNRSAPEWLTRALVGIHDPRYFSAGTPALARLAGRTPQHVNTTLKTCFGRTATEVVNQIRLDYAATQLRMSTKKIFEVCMDCGFQNLGHFYQVFRAQFGMTPRQYQLRQLAPVR